MADRTDKQFTRQDIFFSDFLTNLNRHPSTGSLGLVTNINAVKQAIKNIVLTNYGERLYQPTIGGNIKSSLFNPIDNFSTTLIETSIKNTIFNNDTRVASCKVVATPDANNNAYNVTIQFTIKNVTSIQSVDLTLIRNR